MIGVMDSGVGGIAALKELLSAMPNESFVYFADEANHPYGIRTVGDVRRFTASALSFLSKCGCDAVLLACGTASALALDFCQRNFTFPVYGVNESAVLAAIRATKSKRVAVAATEATVKSGCFEQLFARYAPEIDLLCLPCASLVTLAERGADPCTVYGEVRHALAPLCRQKPDTLILGCTHFSILSESISAFLPHLTLIDSGKEAAQALVADLRHQENQKRKQYTRLRIYTSGDSLAFAKRASHILGERVRVYHCDPYTV